MSEYFNNSDDNPLDDVFKPRLPELLLHLRDRMGWSQKELADAIGVDQSFISRIETGVTKRPTRHTLLKIVDAFRAAGMPVTLTQLEQAADDAVPPDTLDLDERLLRIHDQVSTFAPDTQDAFYDALYASFRLLLAAYQDGQNS